MVSSDVMAELDKRPLQKVFKCFAAVDQDCKVLLQHDWGSRSSMKSNGWHDTPQWECEEESYLPPIQCTMPSYPNCDLDWKPTSRWLPSPQYSDAPFPHIKDNKFPDGIRLLRSSPGGSQGVGAEWSFYPNFGFPFTYHIGKRTRFGGIHLSNRESVNERTTCMERKKKGNLVITDIRSTVH
ncbi:hypothetical protein FKM82_023509 [Ascaphus truei]